MAQQHPWIWLFHPGHQVLRWGKLQALTCTYILHIHAYVRMPAHTPHAGPHTAVHMAHILTHAYAHTHTQTCRPLLHTLTLTYHSSIQPSRILSQTQSLYSLRV